MTGQRRYDQGCPVAHALDLVGDRWALLVVRELRLGPRRFGDLAAALPGIGPSVLTQRLGDLVSVGVLERLMLSRPVRAEGYRLTTWGAELEPVFVALARWGARSPVMPLEGPISDDAVMLGVRTFFPAAGVRTAEDDDAVGVSGSLLVELGRERYHLVLADGVLQSMVRLVAGEETQPTATIRSDADALRSLLVGTSTSTAVLASRAVSISGDDALATALLEALVRRR